MKIKKERDKRKLSVILINDMNKNDTPAKWGLWKFKNNGLFRMNQICVAISSVIILLIALKLQRPNDIKLLKKTLTVSGVSKTLDPAKRNNVIEGRTEGKDNMIIDQVVLNTGSLVGRQYKIVDYPNDGFFPNDADGLVDSVSKRNPFRRKDRWTGPQYSRTSWKTIPFDEELYQVATERYKKAVEIINSTEGELLGIKIEK